MPSKRPSPLLSRRRFEIVCGLLLAVAITLGAVAQTLAAERKVRDATGAEVAVGPARRIVTIGGDMTEIVYALGGGDRIIARDSTSLYPEAATGKPDVGYMRQLSAEGVLSMKPDLIIAVQGSGPPRTIEILKAASVPMVIVPEEHNAAGICKKILMIADVLGETEKGRQLADGLAARFAGLGRALAKLPPDQRKKAIFLMSATSDKPLAAGSGTAADAILTMAGAVNPMAAVAGYKPASDEALVAASPDMVVMMSRGGGPAPTPATVFAMPALRATPAACDRSLIVMDGLYLLGFGPRTADAARDLAHRLYPTLALPDLTAMP